MASCDHTLLALICCLSVYRNTHVMVSQKDVNEVNSRTCMFSFCWSVHLVSEHHLSFLQVWKRVIFLLKSRQWNHKEILFRVWVAGGTSPTQAKARWNTHSVSPRVFRGKERRKNVEIQFFFLFFSVTLQLRKFKEDNLHVGFGSATLALEQAIEKTTANIKWVKENKDHTLKWFTEVSTWERFAKVTHTFFVLSGICNEWQSL